MQTSESWATNKPIYSRLPECYQTNEVTEWLTDYFDELLVDTKAKIDDLPRQLDPLLSDPEWLDFLAPLTGFTGDYWDKTWATETKRLLISNSFINIWANKGSKEVLSLVLNCFGIQHLITSRGNFILGTSTTGDPLGTSAWEYIIYLPTAYKYGNKFKLTQKLNSLYGPCWCSSEIIFNDDYIP
ncbi:MAG: phage tail protein [Nostoc sp. DedVER02]|uniref:phage tail protein n=1 Tax=unclassified Nostoc TaxID=2593658 RepID=UPI002AD309D1|nr:MULTISPECIES: phage tail protein [unclassified Nostoc]MDZ7987132.1 phage tail protein [Nostoc sp. DedVER02]MDZ8110998.1 phage tail protein [Nostoc sp. DedVER01b]